MVGHPVDDRRRPARPRRCGSPATRSRPQPGCPFWVHGTAGTLRGSVLLGSDRLELDDGTARTPVPLHGAWFVDGFAGGAWAS